ncbi:MAG TPA: ATP-binding protein, partial [Caulobacteraceae bacterium]
MSGTVRRRRTIQGKLTALAAAIAGLAVAARPRRGVSDPVAPPTRSTGEITQSGDHSRTVEVEAAAKSANSDFLASLNHEIRAPMNGITAMAERLAAGELPANQRRFAEVIARSGSSLLATIDDILDVSNTQPGKPEREAAPLDPAQVAEDVLSLFWERARAKGLDLAAFIDPATPALVRGDAVRLRQVIGKLVNNAIAFTQTGGVMIQVCPSGESRLRISVHDTGVGIPADKIDGVFGGAGLGLAICKRQVDAMGGRFKVASKVGKGSVFAFDLPMPTIEAAAPWPRFDEGAAALLAVDGASTAAALTRYL